MPGLDEIPQGFTASVIWHFRVATLGTHAVLYATLGLAFGAARRALDHAGDARRSRYVSNIQPFRRRAALLTRTISSRDLGHHAGQQDLVRRAEVGAPVDLRIADRRAERQPGVEHHDDVVGIARPARPRAAGRVVISTAPADPVQGHPEPRRQRGHGARSPAPRARRTRPRAARRSARRRAWIAPRQEPRRSRPERPRPRARAAPAPPATPRPPPRRARAADPRSTTSRTPFA